MTNINTEKLSSARFAEATDAFVEQAAKRVKLTHDAQSGQTAEHMELSKRLASARARQQQTAAELAVVTAEATAVEAQVARVLLPFRTCSSHLFSFLFDVMSQYL